MISWKDQTNEDALKAWDSGDSIWSCSMGGLGPGYEQCIQIMGMEMLRAMLAHPYDFEAHEALTEDEQRDRWRKYSDHIESIPAVRETIERLGPSGAQFGAAMSIASVFARNGYEKGMEMVPEDRRIQVAKHLPE